MREEVKEPKIQEPVYRVSVNCTDIENIENAGSKIENFDKLKATLQIL